MLLSLPPDTLRQQALYIANHERLPNPQLQQLLLPFIQAKLSNWYNHSGDGYFVKMEILEQEVGVFLFGIFHRSPPLGLGPSLVKSVMNEDQKRIGSTEQTSFAA